MAALPATLSAYNAALKEVWTSEKLEDQLYQGDPLLERIERTDRYNIGEYALTPLLTGRSAGYSVVPSSGSSALNSAGSATTRQAKWFFTHHHQQVKLEGAAIDQTGGGTAVAVANAVDTEMTTSLQSLRKQLTRQLFGAGDGKIATCTAGTTGTTTITISPDVTGGNSAIGRRWIQRGMTVDIGTDTDRAVNANDRVVQTVASPTTFTVDGAGVTQTTSNFVQIANSSQGSADATSSPGIGASRSNEMNGLRSVIASGNPTYAHPDGTAARFGEIDATAEVEWNAANVDTTTTTLTLSAVYDGQRNVLQTTGQNSLSVITSYRQQQRFYELLQAQVRFGGDSSLGAGNVGGAEFAGMKVDAHVDCPDNLWFFVNLDDLLVVKGKDPYWQNSVTGGDPLVWAQGTTAFVGMLTYRLNLACRRRNSHAVLTALT